MQIEYLIRGNSLECSSIVRFSEPTCPHIRHWTKDMREVRIILASVAQAAN